MSLKEGLSGGYIWRAKNDILCYRGASAREMVMRRVVVNDGELVEFRYPHDAHFRIDDGGKDLYLYLDEAVFLLNFELVGQVFEEVRFRNQNSMQEIIAARLWKPIKEVNK